MKKKHLYFFITYYNVGHKKITFYNNIPSSGQISNSFQTFSLTNSFFFLNSPSPSNKKNIILLFENRFPKKKKFFLFVRIYFQFVLTWVHFFSSYCIISIYTTNIDNNLTVKFKTKKNCIANILTVGLKNTSINNPCVFN